jgi:hypothetical protein
MHARTTNLAVARRSASEESPYTEGSSRIHSPEPGPSPPCAESGAHHATVATSSTGSAASRCR